MRRIILILTFFVASSSVAFSQGPEWGAKAGLNASKGDPGFYVGLFAEQSVGRIFSIQGELLYASTLETGGGDGGSNETEFDRSYLVLPVMGKLYMTERFSFDFGPQFGILLPDNQGAERFDLSLGAGLSYRIGRRFEVSMRYNWGLIRTAKDLDQYNNTFRLGVGYRF